MIKKPYELKPGLVHSVVWLYDRRTKHAVGRLVLEDDGWHAIWYYRTPPDSKIVGKAFKKKRDAAAALHAEWLALSGPIFGTPP